MRSIKRWNTLRNQIIFVFLSVMVIVLFIVGVNTYQVVSSVLKSNAEKQIQQTAIQASGKMEALYEQVDTLTLQLATNEKVQNMLLQSVLGQHVSFSQRQSLMNVVNSHLAYYSGIDSIEIFLVEGDRLFPLHDGNLMFRLGEEWVEKADEKRGRLVWVGQDPTDPDYFLAMRQITLMDRWFSPGGYLLLRIRDNYFQFEEKDELEGAFMVLLDDKNALITSNYYGDMHDDWKQTKDQLEIDSVPYMRVEYISNSTGWTTTILTPLDSVTKDVSVLKATIVFSGILGFIIFLLFSFILSTLITRPIIKLTKTMRFGRLGALKAHQETSATYEINELNETYNQMVETMNNLIQEVYEKEIIRSHSELKALQAQINPHFLYNTLDALYWSLEEKGEEKLAEYVFDMSHLFRYTITSPKEDDWVTLKEEIGHIERYMKIMRVRFGERLRWNIQCSSIYEKVKIPKLLIQPLVENAILHGIGNKSGPGTVEIVVEEGSDSSRIAIKVIDDGPGMDENTISNILGTFETKDVEMLKGKGMAIVNCNKRLQFYYRSDSVREITFDSKLGKGTCVWFEIPIHGGGV